MMMMSDDCSGDHDSDYKGLPPKDCPPEGNPEVGNPHIDGDQSDILSSSANSTTYLGASDQSLMMLAMKILIPT